MRPKTRTPLHNLINRSKVCVLCGALILFEILTRQSLNKITGCPLIRRRSIATKPNQESKTTKKKALIYSIFCVCFSLRHFQRFFLTHIRNVPVLRFFFVISGSEKFYLPSYRTLPTRVRVWHKKNVESSFAPRGATI